MSSTLDAKAERAILNLKHATKENLSTIVVPIVAKHGFTKAVNIVKAHTNISVKKHCNVSQLKKDAKRMRSLSTLSGGSYDDDGPEVDSLFDVRTDRQQSLDMERFMASRIPDDSPVVLYERAMGAINALEWADEIDIPHIYKDIEPYLGKEETKRVIEEMTPFLLRVPDEESKVVAPPPKADIPSWLADAKERAKNKAASRFAIESTKEADDVSSEIQSLQNQIKARAAEVKDQYAQAIAKIQNEEAKKKNFAGKTKTRLT